MRCKEKETIGLFYKQLTEFTGFLKAKILFYVLHAHRAFSLLINLPFLRDFLCVKPWGFNLRAAASNFFSGEKFCSFKSKREKSSGISRLFCHQP
jgi:hypothetical protein